MKEGLVSSETGRFFSDVTESIEDVAVQKNQELDDLMEHKYVNLFTSQPYEKIDIDKDLAASLLNDPQIRSLFHLN